MPESLVTKCDNVRGECQVLSRGQQPDLPKQNINEITILRSHVLRDDALFLFDWVNSPLQCPATTPHATAAAHHPAPPSALPHHIRAVAPKTVTVAAHRHVPRPVVVRLPAPPVVNVRLPAPPVVTVTDRVTRYRVDRRHRPSANKAVDFETLYHVQLAKNAKRKRTNSDAEPKASLQGMGRGIRKLAALFGEIVHIIADAQAYERNPLPDDHGINEYAKDLTEEERAFLAKKRDCERNYEAYVIIDRLIPGLTDRITKMSISEKMDYFVLIQKGANDARSDDFGRVTWCMGTWINNDLDKPDIKVFDHTPPITVVNEETGETDVARQRAPHLDTDRRTRGVEHDITGALLTSVSEDWKDPAVRAAFRSPPPNKIAQGYLKGRYLVKSYKAVFTAPSSAKDDSENTAPTNKTRKGATGKAIGKNVATRLGMNGRVTPRSIAYIAVLVWFSLTTVSSWNVQEYYKVSLQQLYDFIVDFFEGPAEGSAAKRRVDELLSWWNQQIFPNHSSSADTSKAAVASRAALWSQMADEEEEEV
ncbi:hypothetical protein B0H19DRAFT_1252372 [Mycena capillaripes]|nr:hypothetical protein B0H19DRAFT_1252372 [Mycena capillaripes]